MSIRVVLVDDHAIVRDGIKSIIERKSDDIEIIGEAANGEAALQLAQKEKPDIYIVDISLPIINGLDLTARLKKLFPESKIIILSMHDKHTLVEKALKCGAQGYVVKESAAEEVITAIREVMKGRFFLSPQIAGFVVSGFLDKDFVANRDNIKETTLLSKREREILQLIAEGFTNREIAEKLSRSENTIHVHRTKIMQKLNIHRQADLIRYALKENITSI